MANSTAASMPLAGSGMNATAVEGVADSGEAAAGLARSATIAEMSWLRSVAVKL